MSTMLVWSIGMFSSTSGAVPCVELLEEVVEFCSVVSTTARSIDLFDRLCRGEGDLIWSYSNH